MDRLLANPALAIAAGIALALLAITVAVRRERRRRAGLEAQALRLGLSFARTDPELRRQPFLALPLFQDPRRRDFHDVMRGEGLWVFEFVHGIGTGKNRARRHQTVAAVRVAPRPAASPDGPPSSPADPDWKVQAEGEWVIAFRPGRRVAPADLPDFVARARDLAARYAPLGAQPPTTPR